LSEIKSAKWAKICKLESFVSNSQSKSYVKKKKTSRQESKMPGKYSVSDYNIVILPLPHFISC